MRKKNRIAWTGAENRKRPKIIDTYLFVLKTSWKDWTNEENTEKNEHNTKRRERKRRREKSTKTETIVTTKNECPELVAKRMLTPNEKHKNEINENSIWLNFKANERPIFPHFIGFRCARDCYRTTLIIEAVPLRWPDELTCLLAWAYNGHLYSDFSTSVERREKCVLLKKIAFLSTFRSQDFNIVYNSPEPYKIAPTCYVSCLRFICFTIKWRKWSTFFSFTGTI